MKLPTKFKLNTENFKVYYDDKKKTHVCESIETGEKTNIGVLGIFLQMGILEQVEKEEKTAEELSELRERLNSLEDRVIKIQKSIDNISVKEVSEEKFDEEEEDEEEEEIQEEETPEEENDTSEIKKRVMENVIEKAEKTEETEIEEEPAEDVTVESDEEVNNWLDI